LEFEALRDSLLAIGGTLETNMYGKPVDLEKDPSLPRRTIYGRVDRADVSDVLINFDFANPDLPSGRRHETTVPQQALFLMNSPLVIEQAKKLTGLTEFDKCLNSEARIQFLYERVYQRPARPEEVKLGLEFITDKIEAAKSDSSQEIVQTTLADEQGRKRFRQKQQQAKQMRGKNAGNGKFQQREPLKIWEEYAHALLQANETSFVN
jgi:hypothetical protein